MLAGTAEHRGGRDRPSVMAGVACRYCMGSGPANVVAFRAAPEERFGGVDSLDVRVVQRIGLCQGDGSVVFFVPLDREERTVGSTSTSSSGMCRRQRHRRSRSSRRQRHRRSRSSRVQGCLEKPVPKVGEGVAVQLGLADLRADLRSVQVSLPRCTTPGAVGGAITMTWSPPRGSEEAPSGEREREARDHRAREPPRRPACGTEPNAQSG